MSLRPTSRALRPFWIWWGIGGGTFVLGIMIVGAIPGNQVLLSDVLTATWPVCLFVGIYRSQARFWKSPLAVWAFAAMASVVIARWFLSTTTVNVFLLVWTLGFIVAAIWWYRASRWDGYLAQSIQSEDPSSTDVIDPTQNQEPKTPTAWYRRRPVIIGGLGALVLIPLSLYQLNQSDEDPAASDRIFDAIGDQISSSLTPAQQSELCAIVDDIGDDIWTNNDHAYNELRGEVIDLARDGVSAAELEIADAGPTDYAVIGWAALDWFCSNR